MNSKSTIFLFIAVLGFLTIVGDIFFEAIQKDTTPQMLAMVVFPVLCSFSLFSYIRTWRNISSLPIDTPEQGTVRNSIAILFVALTLTVYYAAKL